MKLQHCEMGRLNFTKIPRVCIIINDCYEKSLLYFQLHCSDGEKGGDHGSIASMGGRLDSNKDTKVASYSRADQIDEFYRQF